MFKIGEKLALNDFSSYRSMYPVFKGDELIAFVAYENGWGKNWVLCRLALKPKGYRDDLPQYDGCIPITRKGGSDGAVNMYKKDGRGQALEYLADDRNRESFPTKAQLIDKRTQTFNNTRRTYANLLAACIKKHAQRIKQREVLTQLLAMDSLLVGEERLMMLDLLNEMVRAVDYEAKGVEESRKSLEEYTNETADESR